MGLSLSMAAREHWIETLRCPRCRRVGLAHVSADDNRSWEVRADDTPLGFKFIEARGVDNFYCGYCDIPAEP